MTSCTELLEALDKACTVDNTVPEGQRAAEWRRYAKARLARAPIAPDHFAACVKALERLWAESDAMPQDAEALTVAEDDAQEALAAVRTDLEAALEHADGA